MASVLLAAVGVVALACLPYLLAPGSAVLGYLPGSRGGGTDDDEPEHFPGQSVRCGRAGFMRCVAR